MRRTLGSAVIALGLGLLGACVGTSEPTAVLEACTVVPFPDGRSRLTTEANGYAALARSANVAATLSADSDTAVEVWAVIDKEFGEPVETVHRFVQLTGDSAQRVELPVTTYEGLDKLTTNADTEYECDVQVRALDDDTFEQKAASAAPDTLAPVSAQADADARLYLWREAFARPVLDLDGWLPAFSDVPCNRVRQRADFLATRLLADAPTDAARAQARPVAAAWRQIAATQCKQTSRSAFFDAFEGVGVVSGDRTPELYWRIAELAVERGLVESETPYCRPERTVNSFDCEF